MRARIKHTFLDGGKLKTSTTADEFTTFLRSRSSLHLKRPVAPEVARSSLVAPVS
jgi:hypothetical protein